MAGLRSLGKRAAPLKNEQSDARSLALVKGWQIAPETTSIRRYGEQWVGRWRAQHSHRRRCLAARRCVRRAPCRLLATFTQRQQEPLRAVFDAMRAVQVRSEAMSRVKGCQSVQGAQAGGTAAAACQ